MADLDAPKKIDVSISLANGQFSAGGNTANITGLRVSCHIEVTGGLENNTATLAIFGLPLSVMNALTTFGSNYLKFNYKNTISITAGSDEEGMTLVFQGVIFEAFVDGQAQPQVCLRIQAAPGAGHNVTPQTPLSFQGSTKAADIAQKIAGYLGMSFVDNGVKTILSNPYYASDAVSMIHRLAEHAGFFFTMDRGTLTITPPGGSNSNSGGGVLIAPPKMVAYPIFISNQLVVKTKFDPNIKVNDIVQVQSSLTPACGSWRVFKIEYDIESFMPHGKWFSTFFCNPAQDSAPQ